MQAALNEVTQALLLASAAVPTDYFQLPVADQEEPEYRERVYCYELYHQWRLRWPQGLPYSLCGEIDKQGHPVIRGGSKPDFLVHHPGAFSNLLIVEVKPANIATPRIVQDMKKLTQFRRGWSTTGEPQRSGYYAACLWLYGAPLSEWPQLRDAIVASARDHPDVDLALVSCFLHSAPSHPAERVVWT